MGYEEINNKWVLKTFHAPVVDDDESDKEDTIDILPPSPIDAPSRTAAVSLVGVGPSASMFNYASSF